MSKNSSVNGDKHPYMRPEKFNPFWRSALYSEGTQAHLEQWLTDYKASKKNPELMEVRRSQN